MKLRGALRRCGGAVIAICVLGWITSSAEAAEPRASVLVASPPAPEPKPRVIGTILPPLTLSTRTDVWWTAPSAPLTVALGAGAASATRSALAVGRFIAQGSWEWITVDGLLHTPAVLRRREPGDEGSGVTGTNAWAGVRLRLAEADEQALEFAFYGRVGFPISAESTTRSDLGMALGGVVGPGTWLFNVGARLRHGDYAYYARDAVSPYVLLGPTWDLHEEVRVFVLGSFQGLLVGPYEAPVVGNLESYIDFAGHVHLGAEVRVGSILLGPSLMLTPAARPREPRATMQLWLGYVP